MSSKKRVMKNNKGFTLVEIMVSIAALGIICAVLLRLFVLAGSTSDMATDMQNAELYASTAVESIVCAETVADGIESLGLSFASDAKQYSYQKDGLTAIIEIADVDGDYPGTLYEITVTVSGENEPLACISTKKYEQVSAND